MILERVKEGRVLAYKERLKGYVPLQLKEYVCQPKKNGVTTLQLAILEKDLQMV